MGNVFAGTEIVEVGIQIEKNGKDFYEAVAEKSKNEKAKKIFEYLAGEEAKHIAIFQGILDSAKKYEPSESYPGEYFAYMNTLAGDYVFTKKDKGQEAAKKVKNDKEAVELGIKFEKDSVIFYEHMKNAVPESDHKPLNALIAQELRHLQQLYGIRKDL